MSTATVETLTAEVRVLMVGNRQVTLSVARQLDAYGIDDDGAQRFTPFGRVRTGAKGTEWIRCGPNDRGAEAFEGRDRGMKYEKEVVREWDCEWIGRDNETGVLVLVHAMHSEVNEFDDEWRATLFRWSELPLIVLAGLR